MNQLEWLSLNDKDLLNHYIEKIKSNDDTIGDIEEEILERMKIGKDNCPVCKKEISADVAYCSKECGEKDNYGFSPLQTLLMKEED